MKAATSSQKQHKQKDKFHMKKKSDSQNKSSEALTEESMVLALLQDRVVRVARGVDDPMCGIDGRYVFYRMSKGEVWRGSTDAEPYRLNAREVLLLIRNANSYSIDHDNAGLFPAGEALKALNNGADVRHFAEGMVDKTHTIGDLLGDGYYSPVYEISSWMKDHDDGQTSA